MENIQRYELEEVGPNEFALILHLDDQMTEFAQELGTIPRKKNDILTKTKQIINARYPKVKVTMVKVLLGGIVVSSIPLMSNMTSAQAAELPSTNVVATQSEPIYYQVSSEDTLWKIANKFNTNIGAIKEANGLTSDVLQINQKLIIPKVIYTVKSGDYLWVLAQNYGTTVQAIKEANGLTSDAIQVGQTLIIPSIIDPAPSEPSTPIQSSSPTKSSAYTVVSGDSLSKIAKQFNTTVSAIKTTNGLTSDLIRVGQTLTIPGSAGTEAPSVPPPVASTIEHTVVSGDTLWEIANEYNVSLDRIRSSNNLESDLLQIGQTIVVPLDETGDVQESPSPTNNQTYTVVSGDSLSKIANQYGVSISQLKQVNQLTSDTIYIGQKLTIPSGDVKSSTPSVNMDVQEVQRQLQTLGYYAVPTFSGSYDSSTTQAIQQFQRDYGLAVTGQVDQATSTAIEHAVVKKEIIEDAVNYLGVPYLWGGTTPNGFDCSGFVYYMFNQHGVDMPRNTSAGLYTEGVSIDRADLQPGDLVFFSVNTTGRVTHVGFYMGDNQWISATISKGIAVYSMDNSYWSKYYTGAKRVY